MFFRLTLRDSEGKGHLLSSLLLAAGEISKNDQSLFLRFWILRSQHSVGYQWLYGVTVPTPLNIP